MKLNILCRFLFLQFFCINALYATPVITDVLIVDTDTFNLYTFPLEDYFVMKGDHKLGDDELVEGWPWSRGYMAIWRIEGSDLYLVDLRLANGKPFKLEDEFMTDKVRAVWFSGELHSPQGDLIQYQHAPYASVYEKEVYYQVDEGAIIDTVEKKNVEYKEGLLYPGQDFIRDTIASMIQRRMNKKIWADKTDRESYAHLVVSFTIDGQLDAYSVLHPNNDAHPLHQEILKAADVCLPQLPHLMPVDHPFYHGSIVDIFISCN